MPDLNRGSSPLGLLVILLGVIAGIILVLNPQLLNSRALVVKYKTPSPIPTPVAGCVIGLVCQKNPAQNAIKCKDNSKEGFSYCCPKGENLINNKCVKLCDEGLYCSEKSGLVGSRKCIHDDGSMLNCCPKGRIIKNNRCVIPFKTSDPQASPTPVNCDADWVALKCGGGSCASYEREYAKFLLPQSCGKSTKCVPDTSCGPGR